MTPHPPLPAPEESPRPLQAWLDGPNCDGCERPTYSAGEIGSAHDCCPCCDPDALAAVKDEVRALRRAHEGLVTALRAEQEAQDAEAKHESTCHYVDIGGCPARCQPVFAARERADALRFDALRAALAAATEGR